MSTPINERVKEEFRELQQLTPPDSDSDREKDDKPFRCGYPKCNYETNRRNNLKRHMMTMHERLSSPHYCCGVTFFRKADMRAHTKEVHSDGYPCTWPGCGKGFVRKALLDRHLKIHTGEKPFVCPVCQYGTSHKSNLDRHVRIHFKGPSSPGKFYPPSLYDPSQLQHPSVMIPPPVSHPFQLPTPWSKPDLPSETKEHVSALPDSTSDHVATSVSGHVARHVSPRRHSFLFSPDKFSVPFSPCNLDSITPLKLSPIKSLTSTASKLHDLDPSWCSPSNIYTPIKLPGSLGLTPNTSAETDGSTSGSKGASFLSAPSTPPTPGKRKAGQAFSHGIRSILGEAVNNPDNGDDEDDEDVDVDGDSSDEYTEGDEDDYVPKKLRLAKKHSFSEA